MASERGAWTSRLGFILAAAGSAVGLGNIWKFPFITGNNGGGLFVLLYIVCIAAVGLPIIIAEIALGRSTQKSPVSAMRALAGRGSSWVFVGWLGLASGFLILSYYSVVAGWTIHYCGLALFGHFSDLDAGGVKQLFGDLVGSAGYNLGYHGLFMAVTMGVVVGGVKGGIERCSRLLMPLLALVLIGLAIYGATLPGFGDAAQFMFGADTSKLRPVGALEAVGQAFFTLSLGMGAMLTYGSYLSPDTNLLRAALWVAAFDTLIAVVASMVIFPITFSAHMQPGQGPGLVFVSLPLAFGQMPAGWLVGVLFFFLLLFAALTSAISLLEVVTSSFIDLYGWTRQKATVLTGAVVFVVGIPSALSGGDFFGKGIGRWVADNIPALARSVDSFLGAADYLASNWMLPLGGLLISLFCGWKLDPAVRNREYDAGGSGAGRGAWIVALRFVAPAAVLATMAYVTGALHWLGLVE